MHWRVEGACVPEGRILDEGIDPVESMDGRTLATEMCMRHSIVEKSGASDRPWPHVRGRLDVV